jgi:sugar phosphate isomerase/epimerase
MSNFKSQNTKVGIQTRPWGPEKNRQQLPQVLAEIASAGYDGVEIGAQHLDFGRPEAFRQLVTSHGLQPAAIHTGGEIYDPQAVKKALENLERTVVFAAKTGAQFLAFSGKMKENRSLEEMQVEAENLGRVGQFCKDNGIRLAYHNHYWEIQEDCRELRYLCEHTDPSLVSLCLDVAWVHRADGNPAEVARTFLDRIAYFHIKDTTDTEWREVGYGDVDMASLFQVIRAREFPWLVVEQDETQRAPVESARMSREYLRQKLAVQDNPTP